MKKKLIWTMVVGIILVNALAFVHAYRFTHFTNDGIKTNPDQLSRLAKIRILLTGIDNPRPKPRETPSVPFQTVTIESDVKLEAWKMDTARSVGTVVLFHGYSGEKSMLLKRAMVFRKLGYNTFLVDFKGSGGSEGRTTTIGFDESREVIDCIEHLRAEGVANVHLFGTSMGAAAILKALHEQDLKPSSIILECPFGRLDQTVAARFRIMGAPAFPMADILTFWGGVQNGYWAFSHNPQEYAARVRCPALLLFGEKDDRVSRSETDIIFKNLAGEKRLVTYPDQGHDLFTIGNQGRWIKDVSSFMEMVDAKYHSPGGSE